MRIKFGRHKGELLSEIPLDYLQWLQRQEIDRKLLLQVEYAIDNYVHVEVVRPKIEGKSEFFARRIKEREDEEMELLSKIVGYKVIM